MSEAAKFSYWFRGTGYTPRELLWEHEAYVFTATEDLTGQLHVVKLLPAEAAQPRFELEARALELLRHPNVVRFIRRGKSEAGYPFYAMEHVPGRSLAEMLKADGRIKVRQALHLLIEALQGLDAGHRAGIVHRDFAPRNILVGVNRQVRVLDFGSAALLRRKPGWPDILTTSTEFVGSYAHASPEHLLGEALDVRSDVYSAGACLYHCLVGVPPFTGTEDEQVAGHLKAPPPALKVAEAESTRLAVVVASALAKDPSARPPTAIALSNELRRVLSQLGRVG